LDVPYAKFRAERVNVLNSLRRAVIGSKERNEWSEVEVCLGAVQNTPVQNGTLLCRLVHRTVQRSANRAKIGGTFAAIGTECRFCARTLRVSV